METFIFNRLHLDVIHHIFLFTGVIYFHRGKYIQKIGEDDYRKPLLRNIPKPIRLYDNTYHLYLINKTTSIGYIIKYIFNLPNHHTKLLLIFNKGNHHSSYIDNTTRSEWYIIPKTYSKWRRVLSYNTL